jgi:hypothetical protein
MAGAGVYTAVRSDGFRATRAGESGTQPKEESLNKALKAGRVC